MRWEGENANCKSRKVSDLSITDEFKESDWHFHRVVVDENDIKSGQKSLQLRVRLRVVEEPNLNSWKWNRI